MWAGSRGVRIGAIRGFRAAWLQEELELAQAIKAFYQRHAPEKTKNASAVAREYLGTRT
jgi:hypothetical protein